MRKIEQLLYSLNKSNPGLPLSDSLEALKNSGAPSEALDLLHSHFYNDTMTQNHGNKYAFNDFLKKNPLGIFIHVDLNDFSYINQTYGDEVGDQAILSYAKLASKIAQKYGLKPFRISGDKFNYHGDSPEQTIGFIHELKSKLTKESINGTNALSASFGVGSSPKQAEESLLKAKSLLGGKDPQTGCRIPLYPPGCAPCVSDTENLKALTLKEPAFENPLKSEKDLIGYAILSDASPSYPVFQNKPLTKTLDDYGIKYKNVVDKYGYTKNAVFTKIPENLACVLAKEYGQDTVVYFKSEDKGKLLYVNGINEGKFHPLTTLKLSETKPESGLYSLIKSETVGINPFYVEAIFDFNQLL